MHRLVADPTMSPISKIRKIKSPCALPARRPIKILRNSMNAGPDRVLVGNSIPVVQLAFFLNVAARLIASLTCRPDLEQFTEANPSKIGRKWKLNIELQSDTDSDDSSDSQNTKFTTYNFLVT
jgi:hypothetical protein